MHIELSSFTRLTRVIALLMAVVAFMALAPSVALADDPLAGGSATLSIPSLGLTAAIVHAPLDASLGTWATGHLGSSVGHFEYTPWLGQRGNIVLGGHATHPDGSPSIFYGLDGVQVGDRVVVTWGSISAEYEVSGLRFAAIGDLSPLSPTRRDTLTLLTCAGFNGETGVYESRLVVTARRIS
jgi:LPXTG-site transpeptidase (sortase) family protein